MKNLKKSDNNFQHYYHVDLCLIFKNYKKYYQIKKAKKEIKTHLELDVNSIEEVYKLEVIENYLREKYIYSIFTETGLKVFKKSKNEIFKNLNQPVFIFDGHLEVYRDYYEEYEDYKDNYGGIIERGSEDKYDKLDHKFLIITEKGAPLMDCIKEFLPNTVISSLLINFLNDSYFEYYSELIKNHEFENCLFHEVIMNENFPYGAFFT